MMMKHRLSKKKKNRFFENSTVAIPLNPSSIL